MATARYADRMERRQAEFLVRDNTPLSCTTRLGVIDAARRAQVQALMEQAGVGFAVEVMPSWYF